MNCPHCGKPIEIHKTFETLDGQNNLGPSDDRWMERARTYTGIAEAMADQWTRYLRQNEKADRSQPR